MMNKNKCQQLAVLTSLTAIIFIVYAQVLLFGFVNIDDNVYVSKNAQVLNGLSSSGIVWAFTSTYAGFWHPITWLSLMVDSQLYGTWIGGYHLTNLLLHIASTFLLLLVFYKMTGAYWKSLLVAALFALHPLHVESVAWIAERKDVLSAFWGVLTLYAYVRYVEKPVRKRYLLVLSFFLVGLMSKPMLVTFPFLLFLLDYWPLGRLSFDSVDSSGIGIFASESKSVQHLILEKIPLLILMIPFIFVTLFAERQFGALASLQSFPLDERIYNAIISYARYIEKTILPLNLSVYYPHPGLWPWWELLLAGSIILLISFWVVRKSKCYPYLIVGWLWYLGTLVPVIGIIQVGEHAMADRYSYIPLIGLFIMFAWSLGDAAKRSLPLKKIFVFASLLIIFIFSMISWQRCQLWGNSHALWNDVLKNYQVAYAYNYQGQEYARKKRYDLAVKSYNKALQLNPKYVHVLNNRALTYEDTGRYQEALKDYQLALILQPKFADAYYNRGLLYLSTGELDEAIVDFTEAININPDMADAYNNRGLALRLKGRYDKAFADLNQALKINSQLAEAYFNRGILYNILRQYGNAVADFTAVESLKPQFTDAYFYRGVSLAFLGRYNDAIRDFQHVTSIDARHVPALNNLGNLLKKMKRYGEASVQYQKVLQIIPDNQNAMRNLKEIENLKRSNSWPSAP